MSRDYDNRSRERQAARTRRRIIDTARALLLQHGYAATTIALIARHAGVSADTIYKAFGSKRELVRRVLAVSVVGDDEQAPLAERPEMTDLAAAPTGAEFLRRYAHAARQIYDRLGALPALLMSGARAGEPDLSDFATAAATSRLTDAATTIDQLAAVNDLSVPDRGRARDILWTLNSPELHHLLTSERGWNADEYETWLAETLIATLLP